MFKDSKHRPAAQRRQVSQREQFIGEAEKGIVLCERCHGILYKKQWHHADSKRVLDAKLLGLPVHTWLCPACKMITNKQWEGEIFIEAIPQRYEAEVLHLAAAYGKRAERHDPQDRIIEIKKEKTGYHVKTTENQLAVKLAKKIHQVFPKTELQISYAQDPYESARVVLKFI
jgi:hypothetical protein